MCSYVRNSLAGYKSLSHPFSSFYCFLYYCRREPWIYWKWNSSHVEWFSCLDPDVLIYPQAYNYHHLLVILFLSWCVFLHASLRFVRTLAFFFVVSLINVETTMFGPHVLVIINCDFPHKTMRVMTGFHWVINNFNSPFFLLHDHFLE